MSRTKGPFLVIEMQKVFHTQKECAEHMGVSQSAVSHVLAGRRPTLRGYHFRYLKLRPDGK